MADLDGVASDVRDIKRQVQAQGSILKLMMYSQATEYGETILQRLVEDPVLLEVYRRIDGVRTKSDLIKEVLALRLPGGGRSAVYEHFTELENLGVIEPAIAAGRSGIYVLSEVADGLRLEHDRRLQAALKAASR